MKFLLITYNDTDGVGQTVINLNSNIIKLGHESKTILLHKSSDKDNNIIKIKRSFLKRFFFYFFEFFKKKRVLFSFGNSTTNYNSIKKYIEEADTIIIYTLHKFLSFNMLETILKTNKNIYLRPLDIELAAGGCHVNFLYENGKECKKFETGCNKCPQLNFFNIFNISNKIFKKKKEIFDHFRPKLLLENNFTKKLYDSSPVTQNTKNNYVYLTVRDERKKYFDKNNARSVLNLDTKSKILLFGTFNLDAPHKGGRIINEIMENFKKILEVKIKKQNQNKIKLITFGRKNNFNFDVDGIEWIHLGEIADDNKLNLLYRASDLFLSPSTGCNGPATIREAIVNNLPVIAFNKGEAEESLIDGVNGYVIPCFNKNLFAEAIYKSLYLNELNVEKDLNESIKLRYNSISEAKKIVKIAKEDFEKMKK